MSQARYLRSTPSSAGCLAICAPGACSGSPRTPYPRFTCCHLDAVAGPHEGWRMFTRRSLLALAGGAGVGLLPDLDPARTRSAQERAWQADRAQGAGAAREDRRRIRGPAQEGRSGGTQLHRRLRRARGSRRSPRRAGRGFAMDYLADVSTSSGTATVSPVSVFRNATRSAFSSALRPSGLTSASLVPAPPASPPRS